VPRAEMNGTAKEPLEFRDLVVARVTEPDVAGTQPGVGEKSEGSNEVRGSKLDGLSRRGQPNVGKLVVDRNLSRR